MLTVLSDLVLSEDCCKVASVTTRNNIINLSSVETITTNIILMFSGVCFFGFWTSKYRNSS